MHDKMTFFVCIAETQNLHFIYMISMSTLRDKKKTLPDIIRWLRKKKRVHISTSLCNLFLYWTFLLDTHIA